MIKLFSLFVFIFVAGCSEAGNLYSRVYVDEYRDLIGKSLPDIKAIFGVKNVKSYSLSGHDPESVLPAFKIIREDKAFFIIGRDSVESLLFKDHMFKTEQGVQIGRGYCEVVNFYSGAEFYFGFEEGGTLQLKIESKKTLLIFNTSNLPIGEYVMKGLPSKNDKSLCSSKLTEIEIYR
jgi:hypothetical protein